MLKLLNRISWIISILIWIQLIWSLWLYYIWYEWNIILWIILWFFLKKLLLSENFIKERLEFFANSIKDNYMNLELKPEKTKVQVTEPEFKLEKIEKLEITDEEIKEEINTNKEPLVVNTRKERISDLWNSNKYIKAEKTALDIFFEKLSFYIKDFFSTNLLAKLWWILVFLAVVYFLKWFVWELWEIIWPVWRITLWIIIWFITYFIWVKIHSNYENEGLILMWTWILINFAVILWWRYLVWDWWYLAETTTFIFLILNSVFWVITSLVYKSNTLLLFSFIFAYLNPFIIWAESNGQPYTLIWYSLIVSLWALFTWRREANLSLVIMSFIFWNLLFLIAPFSDSIWWSSKIILTSIFSLITIIAINKFKWLNLWSNKALLYTFIGTYIYIILNLLNSTSYVSWEYLSVLSETSWFIVYNLILLSLFIFSIKIISNIKNSNSSINLILLVPLILLIWILFSWNLILSPFVLVWTILIYLIWFIFIQSFSTIFSFIYFWFLGVFIFMINFDLSPISWNSVALNSTEFFSLIISSIIFLFSSYYYSKKEQLGNLFSIWTIWTIFILAPIIVNKFYFMDEGTVPANIIEYYLSIIAIFIFALSNLILPFINKNLLKKENLNNLVIWSLLWALFFSFQIYNYWEIHFKWVTEGFAFLALAIVYFIQAYFIANKLWIENIKSDENLKNIIYNFLWISISLFSVSVAFVFANHPEIITTTWLFEATILYFFYSKNWSKKIYTAATVLFIIWLTKFWVLVDVVRSQEYFFLISFIVILSSFLLNLKFINTLSKNKEWWHNIHHIWHVIWMIIMWILLLEIIPSTWTGWSIIWISIFITLLWSFYAKFNFNFLKRVFILIISLVAIFHIYEIESIFRILERRDLNILKILQYTTTFVLISNIFIWKKLNNTISKWFNKVLIIILSIYSFIISNMFIIDLFGDIFGYFTLTIYWWLIAASLLVYGIQRDITKYRTVWLYFLTLTSAKIFLFDVWQIWETNSRVAVFAILWVIYIIISTLYTKRFWNNLLWEFRLSNLKDQSEQDSSKINKEVERIKKNSKKQEEKKVEKKVESTEINSDQIINKSIKDIDISDIKAVNFIFKDWSNIKIRAISTVKISKLIINELDWLQKFKAWELEDIFKYVKLNYKSELSKDNYEKIIKILSKFVKEGWEVELINK